jgi:hypothetical protein
LTDRKTVLEHKLRFAHEQVCISICHHHHHPRTTSSYMMNTIALDQEQRATCFAPEIDNNYHFLISTKLFPLSNRLLQLRHRNSRADRTRTVSISGRQVCSGVTRDSRDAGEAAAPASYIRG